MTDDLKCLGGKTGPGYAEPSHLPTQMVRNEAMCGYSCPVTGCTVFTPDLVLRALTTGQESERVALINFPPRARGDS